MQQTRKQQELVRLLATRVVSDAPDAWAQVRYVTRVLAPYAQDIAYVTTEHGEIVGANPPHDVPRLVRELREVMYRPNVGTWFALTMIATASGSVDVQFDYDNEPEWSRPTEPVFYVQDLERFPRDAAHIPAWLAHQLELGRAQDLEYDALEGPRKPLTPIDQDD